MAPGVRAAPLSVHKHVVSVDLQLDLEMASERQARYLERQLSHGCSMERTENILHTLAHRTAAPRWRCWPTRTRNTAAVPTGQTSTSWRCVLLRGQFKDEQRPKTKTTNRRPARRPSGQDSDSYTYAYETPADDDVSPQSHLVDPPRVWSPQASNGRLQLIP